MDPISVTGRGTAIPVTGTAILATGMVIPVTGTAILATAAPSDRSVVTKITPAELLGPAEEDYNAGRYLQAEKTAQQVIDRTPKTARPAELLPMVQARSLMAYAAARRKDLPLARQRFAVMAVEASKLPEGGKQASRIGEDPLPALSEDAAYQHAVCTAALGDGKGTGSKGTFGAAFL